MSFHKHIETIKGNTPELINILEKALNDRLKTNVSIDENNILKSWYEEFTEENCKKEGYDFKNNDGTNFVGLINYEGILYEFNMFSKGNNIKRIDIHQET